MARATNRKPTDTTPKKNLAQEKAKQANALVLSYLALRQFLGWLGFALPSSLLLWAWVSGGGLQPSISDFYYTPMGDVLVGILCAIGVFLLNYKGYPAEKGEWITDRRVSALAGVAAIGVAFFPVRHEGYPVCLDGQACLSLGFFGHQEWMHFLSAGVFFLCLAIFCLWLFPKSDRNADGKRIWTTRTRIYAGCGAVLLLALLALFAYLLGGAAFKAWAQQARYVFWWETAGILAFALSWLVKGKVDQTISGMVRRVKG